MKNVILLSIAGFVFWRLLKMTDTVNNNMLAIDAGSDQRRGERLNNPLNIERGENWQGLAQSQPDARFAAFVAPEYGIRAFVRILNTYANKYGIRTLSGIINRWAPPTDNNQTAAYINYVSSLTGIQPGAIVELDTNTLYSLANAMIQVEQGRNIYKSTTVLKGVQMGLSG